MSLIPDLSDIEKPLRLMERAFFRPEEYRRRSPFNSSSMQHFQPQEYHRRSPIRRLIPREFFDLDPFFRPWDNRLRSWINFVNPMEELAAAMKHIALEGASPNITADDEKFQVSVDVQHFAPEELNVKVVNKYVVIEGKHEEKVDEHGYVSRQFIRRYALPEGCLPDTVQSSLSSDGVLTVTAPKVLAMPSTGERIVPVTHTGPVKKEIGSSDFEPKESSKEMKKE